MKEEDIFRIVHLIITIGIIFILLGTTLELEGFENDSKIKDKKIKELTIELNKCKKD